MQADGARYMEDGLPIQTGGTLPRYHFYEGIKKVNKSVLELQFVNIYNSQSDAQHPPPPNSPFNLKKNSKFKTIDF